MRSILLALTLLLVPSCVLINESNSSVSGGLSFEERSVLEISDSGLVEVKNTGGGTIAYEFRHGAKGPYQHGVIEPGETFREEFDSPSRFVLEHGDPGPASFHVTVKGPGAGFFAVADRD